MKCDKCFFCTHIGAGIYADFPVKYCKYTGEYKIPFVFTQDHGGVKRRLDLSNMKDLKIWHDAGCKIHPSRVEKAKKKFLEELMEGKDE